MDGVFEVNTPEESAYSGPIHCTNIPVTARCYFIYPLSILNQNNNLSIKTGALIN